MVDERIEANARFLMMIVDYPEIFEPDDDHEEGHEHDDDGDINDSLGDVRREDPSGICRLSDNFSCTDLL